MTSRAAPGGWTPADDPAPRGRAPPTWQEGLDLHHIGPPRVAFSRIEVLHLAGAVLILSYAFSIIPGSSEPLPGRLLPSPMSLVAAFLAVSSGFVLHELAHKIVAQRYGHWAEFRAQFAPLGLTVLVAALAGFLFAAPGAVVIQGRVTPKENGVISLVGPGTNFLVALLVLPFFAFEVNQDGALDKVFATVSYVNALLAIFNLLPLGPFDGRKVWRWSPAAYIVSVVLALALFVFTLQKAALV